MVPELLISIASVSLGALFLHRIFLMAPGTSDKSVARRHSATKTDYTLLVCCHDAAILLQRHIPAWLSQSLPASQIVLIDDGSTDGSSTVIAHAEREYAEITGVIYPDRRGKKAALRDGLSHVRSDYILLTDVDCTPASTDWSRSMLACCEPGGIVVGYSPIRADAGWVSRVARYENLFTAMQYLSAADRGSAYMGVGRNLLYHESVRAYYPEDMHLSGDDDLLVQAASRAGVSVSTCVDPFAWMWTDGPVSWGEYFRQRRRQISVSGSYGFRQKAYLMSHSLMAVIFYMALVGLLVVGEVWWSIGGICAKALLDYILLYRWRTLSIDRDLWWCLIILDPLLLVFHICVGASLLVHKATTWK